MSASAYPLLFAEWKLRNTLIPNRLVFAPTCPTWVANPVEGVFTDQAVAYYEERAAASEPGQGESSGQKPSEVPAAAHRDAA